MKEDINETCRLFTDKILLSAGEFIPHKLATVRAYDKPFYNGYLRRLRRKVNRLHHKAKNTNTLASWDYYRHERNFYFREVSRCKNDYKNKIYKKLDEDKDGHGSFFKVAKSCFKTSNLSMPPILSSDGSFLTDDTAKANAFNTFFSEASKLTQGQTLIINIV